MLCEKGYLCICKNDHAMSVCPVMNPNLCDDLLVILYQGDTCNSILPKQNSNIHVYKWG